MVLLIEHICTDCIKFFVSFFEKPSSFKLLSKHFGTVPRASIIIGTNINIQSFYISCIFLIKGPSMFSFSFILDIKFTSAGKLTWIMLHVFCLVSHSVIFGLLCFTFAAVFTAKFHQYSLRPSLHTNLLLLQYIFALESSFLRNAV